MSKQQRLELTWIGKEVQPRLEPRILIEDRTKGHRASTQRESDASDDNFIIQGDNLLALRALEDNYARKVKCIFIDPPYNTGSAFDQYDDGVEHSIWLSLMRDRLVILRNLLSDDGVIWISIDDNEAHYLKVLCDEVFGRKCFVSSVVWRTSDNSNNNALTFSLDHNYMLVYGRNTGWKPKFLNDESKRTHFKNPDGDPDGAWFDGNPLNNPAKRPNLMFNLTGPFGDTIKHPPNGWRWSKETIDEKIKSGEIRYTKDGKGIRRRTYLKDMEGLPPSSVWTSLEETGHNRQAKYELKGLFPERAATDLFSTPKPERLIKKILDLSTDAKDLVLDSFAGSGTTGAVSHKMGRRWILIELGRHASTDIVPRLQKVVDGEDQGGITEIVGWRGGGGFKFFHLAPSLLRQDRYGQWVISPDYQPEMLAEAVCKLMGFTYEPSRDVSTYWQHGHSTETDFIFVTTQAMTHDALAKLSDDVGEERTLLVACRAYAARTDAFPNLTMKKIPHAVLTRCEWGRDDYSLTIPSARPPQDEAEIIDAVDLSPTPAKAKRGRPRASRTEPPSLFGEKE